MQRLKALLYCLRCHVILLIFIAFLASGYQLRHELAEFLALTEPTPSPEPESAQPPVRQIPARAGMGAIGDRAPERRASTPLPPAPPSAEDLVQRGDFRFRPVEPGTAAGFDARPERRQLLNEARRAYWNGEIRESVAAYQRLLDAFPGHPDFLGELGNIYYAEGARELAAGYYQEAAEVLLDRGERSRSEQLAEILERLAPERGAEIRRRLADRGTIPAPIDHSRSFELVGEGGADY